MSLLHADNEAYKIVLESQHLKSSLSSHIRKKTQALPSNHPQSCRDEAEGLIACLDTSSEPSTPKGLQPGQLTPKSLAQEVAKPSPGALDDSNFPSLTRDAASTKVVTWAYSIYMY